MQEKKNRWSLKNVITLVIFTVIIFILMMLATIVTNVLITPVGAYFAGPGVAALLTGPFYMVMVSKIGKRGVTFFLSLITGLLFLVMGQLYTFITYAIFGMLAELIFLPKGSFHRLIPNLGGFFVYMLAFSAGGFIPMFLIRDQFVAWYQTVGSEESVSAMINVYGTLHGVLITAAITIAGCTAGCYIGRSILDRHVKKARI